MSRTAHQRQQQKLQLQQQLLAQQQMAENEAAAAAAELFDLFCVATTMRQILGLHRNMCELIGLRPSPLNEFYPKLKLKIRSWKAQALWKKFDTRASQRVYAKGNACTGTRVLVIGAGPCGLRTAIEAQLLGAKVVVVEKRDRVSRNNVLHLWPFVITDLRSLGAKKFYGKFCAGSIDHISIRQLQCILLKVALLLGVEVHEGVSFERTIEPSGDGCGWRAAVSPSDHAVSHYEFDVLIGADGKRNTLEGFKRKEFRGKLAIAITANFINKKTEAEAKAEEISGVAFIFNQSFFKELYHTTGIDLENIVYYKDETHYFVMTAKKHSLIDKGVIVQDFADPAELLASGNVNTEKLLDYAREAAEFSTKYQMPNLEFAVNHYGKPDVAMFDFTSMFAAESSCRVIVRKNFRLLQCLVGDSLLEPFWPTGSGCARGFLSSMDAAYIVKLWSNPCNSILGVVAQRESIYRLLNQTTPENLQRDIGSYTVDPATRYPNLNRTSVNVWQIKHLIDTDDKSVLEQTFMDTNALQITQVDTPMRRKRRSGDVVPLSSVLLRWICCQLHAYDFVKDLKEVSDVFTHGKILCALINRYRPDLVDFNAIQNQKPAECNDLAFRILEKEMHIPRIMNGKESLQLNLIDSKLWLNYLEQICEVFRGEIPHVKHPKIDFSELRDKYRLNNAHAQPDFSKLLQLSSKQKAKSPTQNKTNAAQNVARRTITMDDDKLKRQRRHDQIMDNHQHHSKSPIGPGQNADTPRKAKKRRNIDKATNIEERQKRLQEIEENRMDRLSKRKQQRYQQTQNFYKSLHMLQANNLLRENDDAGGGGGENTPFEDYSLFLYRQQAPEFNNRVKELERKLLYPDRERGDIGSSIPRGGLTDGQFSDRIKSMEQRITARCSTDKKPKDLMRAIGRIDSNDWQIREIKKKMEQCKKTEVHGPKGREKVPKWSKEQFQARQNKMAKPNRQDSSEEKYKEIDQTLKNVDKQLKEGHIMDVGERGRNKVASIAGQFIKRDDTSEENKTPSTTTTGPKSSTKVALAFKKQTVSEKCHFCKQTVYLMEKLHIEDLVMHRGCLKCHHCHTNLRLGGYAFDRDDPDGRFYCTQHFRLPAKAIRPLVRKMAQKKTAHVNQSKVKKESPSNKTAFPENITVVTISDESKRHLIDNVTQMEMLDRGQTPERIEFENIDAMSDGEPSEEHIIDEHEWSGRNFLPESNNDVESDISTSDESDTESDSDIYEEANDSPLGVQTLQLATDWIGKQHYTETDNSDEFYDSSEGIADDGKDDTEGEEFQKARELRREEVRLQPLPNLPTDTETEVQTETETSSVNDVELNSATEISTDSEFDHDELLRETPKIFIDDTHLRKPTKLPIKTTVLPPTTTGHKYNNLSHNNNAQNKLDNYVNNYNVKNPPVPQFKPLVQVDPTLLTTNRTPLKNPRIGDYLLNKTSSTEGIASRKSLELKKRYLLGEQSNGGKIQKSGSTSVLDSRIRSFQSNISECQKLLHPGNEISPEMKTFLDRTKLGEKSGTESMRSTTNNILNDLKIEITIQKASSTASTDNEKENTFVNNKNELNKSLEYAETVNTALMESIHKKSFTPQPKSSNKIIEIIDLVTPEKQNISIKDDNRIVDLSCDTPKKEIDKENKSCVIRITDQTNHDLYSKTNENKYNSVYETCDSSIKSNHKVVNDCKPDVSGEIKQNIPDILNHIEKEERHMEQIGLCLDNDENISLLNNSGDNEEKTDCNEKEENLDCCDVKIEVPNIPWKFLKGGNNSASTESSCSSRSSSIGDIEHYILESTTSPETNNSAIVPSSQYSTVPRVEVHDSSGTLMQIDSLMIIDGKYIGDPDDLKYMEIPKDLIVPQQQSIEQHPIVEDRTECDTEPLTVSPEPIEETVIDTQIKSPSSVKLRDSKFDSKNENKIKSLKNLPLVMEQTIGCKGKVIKPGNLNLKGAPKTPTTPIDVDKTPTAEILSRASDSETEPTGTGQILTETEMSDWIDDCISENFIDIEFALNSTKGTIKSNKKIKKKYDSNKLSSTGKVIQEVVKVAPVAKCEDILKSIDIDDIEFMDTGSDIIESSHTTANTNVEFIHTNSKSICNSRNSQSIFEPIKEKPYTQTHQQQIQIKRDEKLGVDYIEQGAYIMQDINKTPVNETPLIDVVVPNGDQNRKNDSYDNRLQRSSQLMQSLTDSSTLNDFEEDTTCALTVQLSSNTAAIPSSPNNKNNVSQPESEPFTIVTSLYESSSLKTQRSGLDTEVAEQSTPSSSERMPKTSLSSEPTYSSKPTPSSNNASGEIANISSNYRKCTEEITYEDYVRALQQKITQISSAHVDSLDCRKQRRKTSRTEGTTISSNSASTHNITQTVTEANCENVRAITSKDLEEKKYNDEKPSSKQNGTVMSALNQHDIHTVNEKVPEIPTLTRKLEEITKERTKQKDLIHDLVMDKLQSKKQLNAEKRLNRSRQRSLLTSPNTKNQENEITNVNHHSLNHSPIESTTIHGGVCTNIKAHYHMSTATEKNSKPRLFNTPSFKEQKFKSLYMSPYGSQIPQNSSTKLNNQRTEKLENDSTNTLFYTSPQKTTTITENNTQIGEENHEGTPVAPLRQNRGRQTSTPGISRSATFGESTFSILTENLRSEARARARLKSNAELGLSPEEKMTLLRKRLQADHSNKNTKDLSRKINMSMENTSKSVNDLTFINNKATQNPNYKHIEHSIKGGDSKSKLDFTSDPNLLASSSSTTNKSKTGHRIKNPERRKSLIQSLSNFFHKNTSTSASTSISTATSTSTSTNQEKRESKHGNEENSQINNNGNENSNLTTLERPHTVSNNNNNNHNRISNSIDGVLSRFRISPRSKEKSKDKKELRNSCTSVSTQCLQLGKSCDITNLISQRDGLRSNSSTPHSSHNTNSVNSYKCKQNKSRSNNNNTQIHKQHTTQQQLQQQEQSQLEQENISELQEQHQRMNHRPSEHNHEHCLNNQHAKLSQKRSTSSSALIFTPSTATTNASNSRLLVNKSRSMTNAAINNNYEDQIPPPIPPLPLNYQRSDDESNTTENREQKKQRAISKASRQAELKRLRIAQEIQREQEEIEVQLKELEARGVLIEKALRGEMQQYDNPDMSTSNICGSDEILLKELLEIWRNITHLKQRDEELNIRQHELQLEHRHAQLKEELNLRLSTNKLEKNSADVAAEGAILNEMLEIVAKRASLRPSISAGDLISTPNHNLLLNSSKQHEQTPSQNNESNV